MQCTQCSASFFIRFMAYKIINLSLIILTFFVNASKVYITFHEEGQGQQMSAKWGSRTRIGGFERAMSECDLFIRLTNADQSQHLILII